MFNELYFRLSPSMEMLAILLQFLLCVRLSPAMEYSNFLILMIPLHIVRMMNLSVWAKCLGAMIRA
ncbi:unnamed protein product [Meloidogyne enterolobii]|uniref:Uncharacterized protein n=1 Tax=Meloidogyne enterolobii TaxID=390850 RepID=A0ACB0ZXU0_MELEN